MKGFEKKRNECDQEEAKDNISIVCVCVWGGGWEERNGWSMTSRTVRAKWAWPPSRVFHTEHKNALMSSFCGLPLTSLSRRCWRVAAFLSCIVIWSRWGRPHLSPAVFLCTIKASHRGAKCADRSPSVSFVVIELPLVLCWLLRHFILMIAGNGAASVNYASASMNRSNTAAKDFQEQTRFVLLMAKQNKQTKKKQNPEGQRTLMQTAFIVMQWKLEKRNKKTVKYDMRSISLDWNMKRGRPRGWCRGLSVGTKNGAVFPRGNSLYPGDFQLRESNSARLLSEAKYIPKVLA